jgi:hypothetical protein
MYSATSFMCVGLIGVFHIERLGLKDSRYGIKDGRYGINDTYVVCKYFKKTVLELGFKT